MRRRHLGSVEVSVDIEDVLSEISDQQFKEAYAERFPGAPPADFDLLSEIEFEIRRGRLNAALCLIEAARTEQAVPEARRQSQYQMAGRA